MANLQIFVGVSSFSHPAIFLYLQLHLLPTILPYTGELSDKTTHCLLSSRSKHALVSLLSLTTSTTKNFFCEKKISSDFIRSALLFVFPGILFGLSSGWIFSCLHLRHLIGYIAFY